METLVDLSYWWWAFISASVSVLCWIYTLSGVRGDYERWLIYMGMALAWTGDSVNKIWFGFNRLAGFPEWMISHWFVPVFSLLVIAGATIHIRALLSRMNERISSCVWMFAPLLTCLLAVVFIAIIRL